MCQCSDNPRRTISRRDLLHLGTAAAGAAAFGVLSGCAKPTPTPQPAPTQAEPTEVVAAATATPAPPTATPAPEPVALTWWCYPFWTGITGKEVGSEYTPYDWPNAKAKEYQEEHPNVTISIEPIDFESGKQKVEVAIASQTWPDLMHEDYAVIRKRATQQVLEPIDSFLTEDDKQDYLFLDVCMYKGQHYAWPFRANAGPFFVNRALFKERNALDLLPTNERRDWTWDEFLAAAKALTFDRDGDNQQDVYGYGMHFSEDAGGYHRTLFLWNFGARVFSEDGSKCIVNSPEAVTGLQFLLDLQDKEGVLLPGVLALNRAKMREVFMQSRAAMYPDNGDLNRTIEKAVGSGQIKAETMDLWPMRAPHLPGREPLMFSDQAGWCVFKQTDDAKRAAAMDFCHFLTDKDNIKAVTANNIFPARKSAGNLYPGDPYQAFLQTLVPLSSSFDTGHPYYFDYRHLETFMYQAVLAHQKTPKAALDELADETNKVLKDAGWQ